MARRHPILIPFSHDHREALGLAFRLHNPAPPGRVTAMTPASTPRSRAAETLDFHERHLVPHFRAEEHALFPFFEASPGASDEVRGLLARLVREHHRLGELLEVISAAARGDGDLEGALLAFADLLEAHVRCEERELFAAFPDLSEEESASLATEIRVLLGRP